MSVAAKMQRPAFYFNRRRLVRDLAVLMVLLFGHGYFLVSVIFSSDRLRSFLEDELGRKIQSPVEILSLNLNLPDRIRVEGVRSLTRHLPGARPWLKAESIDFRVDPLELLRGNLEVRRVEVNRPELVIDLGETSQQARFLFRQRRFPRASLRSSHQVFHDISITRGAVTLIQVPGFAKDEPVSLEGISAKITRIRALHRGLRVTGDITDRWLPHCGYRLDIDEHSFTIRGDINTEDVVVSPELQAHLPVKVRELLRPYQIRGRFSVDFGFRLNWKSRSADELDLKVNFRNCEASAPQLLYPLKQINGHLQTDGTNLLIRDGTAVLGGASLRFSGHRFLGGLHPEENWAAIVEGLSFDENLKARLAKYPAAARLWNDLNPKGTVRAQLRVGRGEDGELRLTADLTSEDLQVSYRRFPYPASVSKARIVWDGKQVLISDLEATAGEARATINAELEPGPKGRRHSLVRVLNGRLDERFRQCLEPNSQRVYDLFSLSGIADAEYEFLRDPEGNRNITIRLERADAETRYKHFPLPLRLVAGEVSWNREKTTVKGLRAVHGETTFRFDGDFRHREPTEGDRILVVAENVPLEDHIKHALKPQVIQIWEQLQPRGTAKASLDFHGRAEGGWRYSLGLSSNDALLCYTKFPYPVAFSACTVDWDDKSIRVLSAQGRHGEAEVTMTGEIPRDRNEASSLLFKFKNLVPDADLKSALPPEAQKALDEFAIQGAVYGGLEVSTEKGLRKSRFSLQASSEDGVITYRRLPVPVQFDLIHLLWDDQTFSLKQLNGKINEGSVSISGTFPTGAEAVASLSLLGTDLRLTRSIRDAFPKPVQDVWNDFGFDGIADVEAKVSWRTGEAKDLTYIVTLGCKDLAARFSGFPAQLSELSGKVTVTNDRVTLPKLEGSYRESPVSVEGAVSWAKGRAEPNLTIHVEDIPLDREFFSLLPAEYKALWKELSPSGSIKAIDYVLATDTEGEVSHKFTAEVADADVTYARFPIPLEGLKGRFAWENASMKIEGLQAVALGADFRATGSLEDGAMTLSFTAPGISFSESLLSKLPKSVREYCADITPRGKVDVAAEVKSEWDPIESKSSFKTELKLSEMDAVMGLPLSNVAGLLRLQGAVRGGELTSVEGTAELSEATVRGHEVRDVTASIALEHGRVVIKKLRASYHGGLIEANINQDQQEAMTRVGTSISNVNVADFSGGFGTGSRLSGLLRGDISFSMEGSNIESLRGSGKLFIEGEELWRLPSLDAVTGLLKVGQDNLVERVEVHFYLDGPTLDIQFLKLQGDQYNIYGLGKANFEWDLDLKLFVAKKSMISRMVRALPLGRINILPAIVESLQASLMQLEMRGPASSASAKSVPLKTTIPARLLKEIHKDGKK